MIRIGESDAGFIPSTRVVGWAIVAAVPSRAPAPSWPGFRCAAADPAQVVAVPLASTRARLAPRRNPLPREPLPRIAADYSVSNPQPGGDEWDALRRGWRCRSQPSAPFASHRLWVT